ncbi:MAG: GNAT family N-acetyltransferase [Thermomicrobiales bacterium]
MDEDAPAVRTEEVRLRDVTEADLPLFFEHQRDPVATAMAAFPAREWAPFMAHWATILADPALAKQTILVDGQVAGNIGSWEQDGHREVGYWLDRAYWGRGVATRALALFLRQVPARPLYAYVVLHNIGSRRVLEKCGFTVCGTEGDELILILEAPAGDRDSSLRSE